MQPFLARLPLFRALPITTLRELGEDAELRRFRKREVLFKEGQPAESVWVIQRGWVYLVRHTPQGIPVTIFTVTPKDVLCGFSAVIGQSAYYASAVAASETRVIRIPRQNFSHLLKQEPGFAERILVIYHARMRHMAETISLAQAPVEQRVAYVLLRLRATFGKTVPVTHQELARMAGTRSETSIRTIASFKHKQWLATSRGKMTVLHPEQLNALLRPLTKV
jgi:CRP/FNR family transcriptional regulator